MADRLPVEKVPPASGRSIALTVATVAVLLTAANALVPPIEARASRQYWLVGRKWALLDGLKAPAELLVLGDSSGNQAVIPSVLKARLGSSALNLCAFGSLSVAHDAWVLEEHIKRVGPPKAVVLVHVHDVWSREPDPAGLAVIPRPWGYWKDLDPPVTLDTGATISLAARRYFPIVFRRSAVVRAVRAPIEVFSTKFELDPDGFMPMDRRNDFSEQAQFYLRYVRENRFSMSDISRQALTTIIELSNRHGFPLYLANGPLYRPLLEDAAFKRFVADMNAEFEGMLARGKDAHLVFRDPLGFEVEDLEGADHVRVAGAHRYSERLAEEIARLPRR